MAWGWRKMLQLRDQIRPHIFSKIGNGLSTSAWFDTWSTIGPLAKLVSPRDIKKAGFSLSSKVAELVNKGSWSWPVAWYNLFPVLINLAPPILHMHTPDSIVWHDEQGIERKYSTATVWESIRIHESNVPWADVVWFANCIPRHAFHVWLICKKKLKTQDKLKQWDVSGNTNWNLVCCSLCNTGPDSHEHLFFKCPFSLQVWSLIRPLAGMHSVPETWEDILVWLMNLPNKKSVRSVVGRVLLAATAYFVWQERNSRLFSANRRSVTQLRDVIVSNVRLKLVTMNFKKITGGATILEAWNLPLK